MVTEDLSGDRKIIRIGLAGLGTATNAMLPAFVKHPGMEIVAAASISEEQLKHFQRDYDVKTYLSVEELCADPNVDAVYIATPTQLHTDHVLLAARSGKHIILEKPIAISLQEGLKMIEAAEQNGVKMVVGHSHSFDPPILKIRELIKSGRLGRLGMIHTWCYTDWIYRPRLKEELDTKLGGGITFRQGSHQFDIIRLIGGGMLKSVRASTSIGDPNRPTEGSHVVFFEFVDGAAGTAVYNGYDHFHTTEITYGIGEWGEKVETTGYAANRKRIKQISQSEEQQIKKQRSGYGSGKAPTMEEENQPFFGLTLVSCEKGDIRQSPTGLIVYGEEQVEEIAISNGENGRDMVVKEFYEGVALNKPILHDGRWGLANLEVCLAVLESARTRKEIELAHQVAEK